MQRPLYCLVAYCLLLLLPAPVDAHKPLKVFSSATRSDPVIIANPQTSQAVFTELTNKGEVDYYRFTIHTPDEEIFASMLIPKLERLRDFSPAFALIGPGLPRNAQGTNAEEILDVKGDEGIIVALYQGGTPDVFFEPFTQTKYWKKQELRTTAPAAGEYYFAVFDCADNTGKYVFCVGKQDTWTLQDILTLPRIWWETRMFVEARTSTYLVVAFLALLIGTVLGKVWAKTH